MPGLNLTLVKDTHHSYWQQGASPFLRIHFVSDSVSSHHWWACFSVQKSWAEAVCCGMSVPLSCPSGFWCSEKTGSYILLSSLRAVLAAITLLCRWYELKLRFLIPPPHTQGQLTPRSHFSYTQISEYYVIGCGWFNHFRTNYVNFQTIQLPLNVYPTALIFWNSDSG